MKATFVILAILINVLSFAQVADDDNDGIPNNDDACPSVAGTKANKGCPGSNGSTREEFISGDVFNKLFNAICSNSLPTIASNQKDGNLTVSNLPLIGKQTNLPILFNVFPNGSAEVYCILSTSNADFQKATNEILNKLNASTVCNGMFNKTLPGYKKDTTVLLVPAVAGNKYYELAIEIPNGKSMVVLHILDYNRIITKEEENNYNKFINKKNVDDDEAKFCRKLKDVVSGFSSGFSLLKWDATVDTLFGFGNNYIMNETYLPFFTKKEEFSVDEEFKEFNFFEATIEGLTEKDAQKQWETFEKRIESCFNKKGVLDKPEQNETKIIVFPTGTNTLTSLSGYNDVAIVLSIIKPVYSSLGIGAGYVFSLKVAAIDVNKTIACNEVETMTSSQKSALENAIVTEFDNILKEAKYRFKKYDIGFFSSTSGYGNDKWTKVKPDLKYVYNWGSKDGGEKYKSILVCQVISSANESYFNAIKLLEKKHLLMGLTPKIVIMDKGDIEYYLGGRKFITMSRKDNKQDAQIIFIEQ